MKQSGYFKSFSNRRRIERFFNGPKTFFRDIAEQSAPVLNFLETQSYLMGAVVLTYLVIRRLYTVFASRGSDQLSMLFNFLN